MAETKKVLIIDDEEDFCFFVRENLMSTGMFEVLVATNGRYGIKLAREDQPDIILLDLMMPDLSGEEVADTLKQNADTEKIPILYVTALATNEDTGESGLRKSGESYFISKPVWTRQLVSAINEVTQN